jgi:hypothetical protein
VTIFAQLTPRFPVAASDGSVTQSVRLWHNEPQPVFIDEIRLRRLIRGQQEPPATTVSVEKLLGRREIGPEGVTISATLDEPSVFSFNYELSGTSSDGLPARGVFAIMRPPDAPTRENSTAVTDPELYAKILRAREILGQQYVTDEDIWRLQRQGRFSDLVVDPNQRPPTNSAPQQPPKPLNPSDQYNPPTSLTRQPAPEPVKATPSSSPPSPPR